MMPRYAVMPRFPYGSAAFPSPAADPFARLQNRLPTGFTGGFWGGFGQEIPAPPEPPLPPPLPAEDAGFPGKFQVVLILGGATAAAVGWSLGSAVTTVIGGAAAAWGLFTFPYAATFKRSVGLAGAGAGAGGRGGWG